MHISQAGIDFIKQFEGCRLKAYQDVVGVWTIGYGHTGAEVQSGLSISQEQAEAYLRDDLNKVCNSISPAIKVSVNENQFAALVSFAYNVGCYALIHSTLLRKVNADDYEGAACEFVRWDHAGGQVVPGLHKRRMAEADLFRA